MSHRAAAALALCVALVAGCSDGDTAAPTASSFTQRPTTTTTAGEGSTTTSTSASAESTTTTAPVVTGGPQPATPSCPAVSAARTPASGRPRYRLDLDVRPDQGIVDGGVTVRFQPDLPTDRLVFRLWPNGPRPARAGAHLAVGEVRVDGKIARTELPDPTTLIVRPPRVIDAGDTVEVALPWRLTLPGSVNDRISRDGDAIRLGSFFPILAWEPGVGWAVEPPTAGFAEASSVPLADFAVSVTVPAGLSVLSTGVPSGGGRWEAIAMRDVAISIGRFAIAEGVANAPDPVQVTVGVHETIGESPQRYLDKTIRVLEDFSVRYGAYPYRTYSLSLTPGLSGGIEYPTHVMQGPATIGRTTSHEVAHMWFYAIVGNNQGRDPWLDEGLATFAEARFEGTLGSFVNRTIPSYAKGRVGEPMTFWEDRQDGYYRGVYVQGAQALAALGSADLVDCALRHYVARQAFLISRPTDLLGSMRLVFPDAERVLASYGAL